MYRCLIAFLLVFFWSASAALANCSPISESKPRKTGEIFLKIGNQFYSSEACSEPIVAAPSTKRLDFVYRTRTLPEPNGALAIKMSSFFEPESDQNVSKLEKMSQIVRLVRREYRSACRNSGKVVEAFGSPNGHIDVKYSDYDTYHRYADNSGIRLSSPGTRRQLDEFHVDVRALKIRGLIKCLRTNNNYFRYELLFEDIGPARIYLSWLRLNVRQSAIFLARSLEGSADKAFAAITSNSKNEKIRTYVTRRVQLEPWESRSVNGVPTPHVIYLRQPIRDNPKRIIIQIVEFNQSVGPNRTRAQATFEILFEE